MMFTSQKVREISDIWDNKLPVIGVHFYSSQ